MKCCGPIAYGEGACMEYGYAFEPACCCSESKERNSVKARYGLQKSRKREPAAAAAASRRRKASAAAAAAAAAANGGIADASSPAPKVRSPAECFWPRRPVRSAGCRRAATTKKQLGLKKKEPSSVLGTASQGSPLFAFSTNISNCFERGLDRNPIGEYIKFGNIKIFVLWNPESRPAAAADCCGAWDPAGSEAAARAAAAAAAAAAAVAAVAARAAAGAVAGSRRGPSPNTGRPG